MIWLNKFIIKKNSNNSNKKQINVIKISVKKNKIIRKNVKINR